MTVPKENAHALPQARIERPRGLGNLAGLLADLRGRGRAGPRRGLVDKAFELGINFIDTANIYGRGAAESFLGETLAGRPRDSYILATKLFFPMTESDYGLSRAQVEKQLDASLKRLRTDHVDLYQCHRYDEQTPLEETMAALTDAVRSGKARYVGFSEWPADKIEAALAHGRGREVRLQPAAIFAALARRRRRR